MPIVITCPCGKRLRAGDNLVGTKVNCPACGKELLVAAPPPTEPLQEMMPQVAQQPTGFIPPQVSFAQPRQASESAVNRGLLIGLIGGGLGLVVVGILVAWLVSRDSTATPQPMEQKQAKAEASPPPPKELERVEATVDTVGTKGKDYGGGIISEPLRQRWRQVDRLLLLQVEHALNLYNGFNGRYPASHEEFMKDLVNSPDYMLKLPELPPGERYVYDPETHKLMVERPAAAPAPDGKKE